MKKQAPSADVWNLEPEELTVEQVQEIVEPEPVSIDELKPKYDSTPLEYSLEGLKADFPAAKELEQFVFDETRISLKLKGLAPDKKYEIALAVLQNEEIDPRYITGANPYVDNNELIPEDPIKPIPARDQRLPQEEPMSIFHDMTVPHPDYEMRALDSRVTVMFKTYANGSISYEIMGPLERHSVGEKLDKYGRSRPEKIVWVDPRTGEQAIRLQDGSYTKMGQKLRTLMESKRVNKNASVWSVWIDRDFVAFNQGSIENPWQ